MMQKLSVKSKETNLLRASESISKLLAEVKEHAVECICNGITAAAKIHLEKAKADAPVETGALRQSGEVIVPTTRSSTFKVLVGFGLDPEKEYIMKYKNREVRRRPSTYALSADTYNVTGLLGFHSLAYLRYKSEILNALMSNLKRK